MVFNNVKEKDFLNGGLTQNRKPHIRVLSAPNAVDRMQLLLQCEISEPFLDVIVLRTCRLSFDFGGIWTNPFFTHAQ